MTWKVGAIAILTVALSSTPVVAQGLDKTKATTCPPHCGGAVPPKIKDVQDRLLKLNFDPGPVDDLWGPKTRAAVEKFQRTRGLAPTGNIDPKTFDSLMSAPSK